jgi:hypothetical protein
VTLWCSSAYSYFEADYYVDEDPFGSPDGHGAAMQAEYDNPGCYYDDWEIL